VPSASSAFEVKVDFIPGFQFTDKIHIRTTGALLVYPVGTVLIGCAVGTPPLIVVLEQRYPESGCSFTPTALQIVLLVRPIRGVHNIVSGCALFDSEHQQRYITEGWDSFLPMLKQARKHFPMYQFAYQGIRRALIREMICTQRYLDLQGKQKDG